MKRTAVQLLILALGLLLPTAAVHAAKRIEERKSQASHTFLNAATEPAFGLVVQLSGNAIVVVDADDKAGPFKNVSKNDTSQITFSNPSDPVQPSDKFELTFRSYDKSLEVVKWWWTDAKGKRLGKKNKG